MMAEVVDIEIKVLRLLLCKVKWHQHAIDFIIIYYVFLHEKKALIFEPRSWKKQGDLCY